MNLNELVWQAILHKSFFYKKTHDGYEAFIQRIDGCSALSSVISGKGNTIYEATEDLIKKIQPNAVNYYVLTETSPSNDMVSLDEVCKWLKDNCRKYTTSIGYFCVDSLIANFKQAMKQVSKK